MTHAITNLGPIPQDPPLIEAARHSIKSEIDKWGALGRSLGLEGSE